MVLQFSLLIGAIFIDSSTMTGSLFEVLNFNRLSFKLKTNNLFSPFNDVHTPPIKYHNIKCKLVYVDE